MTGYTELQVCSNYSFLRGASRIEELMLQAKALGYEALAVTDHNTLARIARAHARAREVGIRLVVGCRLELTDGLPVLAYPMDCPAYARLCRLLTLAKSRGDKGTFELGWKDLAAAGEGLVLVLLPDMPDDNLEAELRRMRSAFPGRCHLALGLRRRPGDTLRLRQLSDMAQHARVPSVVTGDVLYHAPQRRILQDVVTCIREGSTIDNVGYRRERFADRHLKGPEEMARLFAAYPEAVARSSEITASCTFSLAELSYQYPDELQCPDETPQQGGGAGHRPGSTKAGHGQRCHVHHHRGRNGGGQPGAMGRSLRETTTAGAVGGDDRLARPGAARGRGHPRGHRRAGGPVGSAA